MSQNFILLNPYAKSGKAYKNWQKIVTQFPRKFQFQLILTTDAWEQELSQALIKGTRCFIAAGGDGTVNALLNKLIYYKQDTRLDSLLLGAIGLGSSNDFHKPFTHKIQKIPIKLQKTQPRKRDILKAEYLDSQNRLGQQYFIVSASLGLIAEANGFFNSQQPTITFLKRHHTPTAILYAALRTLLHYEAIDVDLNFNQSIRSLKLSNLNILKTNFISGSFHVNLPVATDDGKFICALINDMNRLKKFYTLSKLARGRFTQNPLCEWWSLDQLEVTAKKTFALELDGEVIFVNKVRFSVHHEFIRECH